MLTKITKRIRILPIFIFIAFLTLSVRVNNVFDMLKHPEVKKISISQHVALAKEEMSQETAKLSKALDEGAPSDTRTSSGAPENNFSQSEILILQELAERREALDMRSKEIDKKAIQLKVAEDEIDKKIVQLKEYETKLTKLVNEYNTKEKEKISSLAKLYSTMKPKDAARIFNTLELHILIPLLKEMKPSVSSAIISQMDAQKAKAVTTELIGNNF